MPQFNCTRCNKCCHFPPGVDKKLPIYPEEATILEQRAKEFNIDLRLIEDYVLPDTLNQKILVGRYLIMMDSKSTHLDGAPCPFLGNDGCRIHNDRPMVCHAYPMSLKAMDAFQREIFMDRFCPDIEREKESLSKMKLPELQKYFGPEWKAAKILDEREKKISLMVRQLTLAKKIVVPTKITRPDFEKALQDWDRIDLDINADFL